MPIIRFYFNIGFFFRLGNGRIRAMEYDWK
jgi:hypothetical protein